MTVNEMLVLVRQRLGDMQKVTFSDEELIHCLNDAIDDICIDMANSYDPELLKTVALTANGIPLPDDFIAWQGQFALLYNTDENNVTTISPIDSEWDGENSTLKYFAYKPHVTSLTDIIPFRTGTHCNRLMRMTIKEIKGGGSSDSEGTSQSGGGQGAAQ
jgi:hypothetical protein